MTRAYQLAYCLFVCQFRAHAKVANHRGKKTYAKAACRTNWPPGSEKQRFTTVSCFIDSAPTNTLNVPRIEAAPRSCGAHINYTRQ